MLGRQTLSSGTATLNQSSLIKYATSIAYSFNPIINTYRPNNKTQVVINLIGNIKSI